jgi:formylglycine-generating enzyme required for sulfatase activity
VTVATPDGEQPREILYYRNTIGMEFVLIPADEFVMGSPKDEEGRLDNEGPQHRVKINRPFYMGATEVTQEQYERIVGNNPAQFKGARNPVETVSWEDAVEFCRKLSQEEGMNYRLPTEAEWEYACRAGTTTPFYTGWTISTDQANYDGTHSYGTGVEGVYRDETTPVASFSPNPWGLYDMHGNVWEWCGDWCGEHYYRKSPAADPTGPAIGSLRVLRGGSWSGHPAGCRSAFRFRRGPAAAHYYGGFRVRLIAQ